MYYNQIQMTSQSRNFGIAASYMSDQLEMRVSVTGDADGGGAVILKEIHEVGQ